MRTVTIPKELITKGGGLVILPRAEYEALLERVVPVARLTPAEKLSLTNARSEMARGEYYTLTELKHGLDGTRQKKSRKGARTYPAR